VVPELPERKISTVIEGENSTWATISGTVPQGSILGPLLFLIYSNDIVNEIRSNVYLYADDTSLTQTICRSDPHSAFNILNHDLKRLTEWAKS
jgi:hypothetical protein